MTNWDVNKIISVGLVIMGIGSVAGWIIFSVNTGTSSGTEIPISIISGLVGVLTGKGMAEKHTDTPIGKAACALNEAEKIESAIGNIKGIVNGGKNHGNE